MGAMWRGVIAHEWCDSSVRRDIVHAVPRGRFAKAHRELLWACLLLVAAATALPVCSEPHVESLAWPAHRTRQSCAQYAAVGDCRCVACPGVDRRRSVAACCAWHRPWSCRSWSLVATAIGEQCGHRRRRCGLRSVAARFGGTCTGHAGGRRPCRQQQRALARRPSCWRRDWRLVAVDAGHRCSLERAEHRCRFDAYGTGRCCPERGPYCSGPPLQ